MTIAKHLNVKQYVLSINLQHVLEPLTLYDDEDQHLPEAADGTSKIVHDATDGKRYRYQGSFSQ